MRESAVNGSDGMATNGTPPPLAGLRAVEFAEQISAPFCGKLLAGLGADVIKVEPVVGDPLRDYGPFPTTCHIQSGAASSTTSTAGSEASLSTLCPAPANGWPSHWRGGPTSSSPTAPSRRPSAAC